MKDFLNSWGLTLAMFVPLVGALVMLLVPKAKEHLHKVIALGTSLVVALIGVLLLTNFDYDDGRTLQFVVDKSWIPFINSRYIIGIDGISLPMIALTMLIVPLCIIYSWNHFPEPQEPQGVPHPDPHPRDGHDRHVLRPGPHPLLRLLRGRPAADVLHDRRLGRREAPATRRSSSSSTRCSARRS